MNENPILIGKPRIYPERLAQALRNLFSDYPTVTKAYLAQIFDPSSGEPPHIIVGMIIETGVEKIASSLEALVNENCAKDELVEFILIDTEEKAKIFSSLEPFYISHGIDSK